MGMRSVKKERDLKDIKVIKQRYSGGLKELKERKRFREGRREVEVGEVE